MRFQTSRARNMNFYRREKGAHCLANVNFNLSAGLQRRECAKLPSLLFLSLPPSRRSCTNDVSTEGGGVEELGNFYERKGGCVISPINCDGEGGPKISKFYGSHT